MINLFLLFRISYNHHIVDIVLWPFCWTWKPRYGKFGPIEVEYSRWR